jgi:DNA-binding PadR family transcriptional regulator
MSSTRPLMLGAVRIFQPVHGYFVRRELLSWRADQWAKLNPGSIYNALRTLERDGFITGESSEDKPAKRVYSLTEDGETEFFTLLRESLWRVVPNDKSRLFAALGFIYALSRAEVIEALEGRIAQLDALHREAPYTLSTMAGHAEKPRHIAEFAYLSDALVMGEREWTIACLQRIRDGAYAFEGEPWPGWTLDRSS